MRAINYILLIIITITLSAADAKLLPYDDLFKDHPKTNERSKNDPVRKKLEAHQMNHKSIEKTDYNVVDTEEKMKPQEQYHHDIALMLAFHYQPETVNDYQFNITPWLNYRYYLNRDHKKGIVLKSSIFIDSLIKLAFTNETDYNDFLQQDETYIQGHIGGGWRHYIKNYAFSYFGGLKLHAESITRSFKESNASGDYGYGETSHFLLDYGFYLGADTGIIFGKSSLSNLFMLKGFLIYDYYVELNEHRFYAGISINYLF